MEQFHNNYYGSSYQKILNEKSFISYLLNFGCLIPFNLYYFIEIFDYFYVSYYENTCSSNGSPQIIMNDPNFFQNFASINYVILNKNNLSYPNKYRLKGAIIQERFFKIKEKTLNELSLEAIKATVFLSIQFILLISIKN